MSWHMPCTNSSPIGSTSISAPQCVEPELAVLRVVDLVLEVHELMGRADVELDVLEDRRDVAVAEVERALRAQRIERARGHPLLDRDVEHVLAGVLREHERDADAVLEVAVEQVLAAERREHLPREVGEADGRDRTGRSSRLAACVVGHREPTRWPCRRARRGVIVGVPANRPLSIARIAHVVAGDLGAQRARPCTAHAAGARTDRTGTSASRSRA